MYKKYVTPKIQVLNLPLRQILTSSDSAYAYYCPYIPETKCDIYSKFIVCNSLKNTINGDSVVSMIVDCPYKTTCEDYELFCKTTNDKQR